nr:MAG TPA: hypothetical protein [Caudoviricetes sp.]
MFDLLIFNPTINNRMKNYGVNGRQFIYGVLVCLLK